MLLYRRLLNQRVVGQFGLLQLQTAEIVVQLRLLFLRIGERNKVFARLVLHGNHRHARSQCQQQQHYIQLIHVQTTPLCARPPATLPNGREGWRSLRHYPAFAPCPPAVAAAIRGRPLLLPPSAAKARACCVGS